MDEMFDKFLTESNGPMVEILNTAMDVAETETAFEVKMDLPGVSAEDVDIQIDNNTLTVRGHRSHEAEKKDDKTQYHRVERFSGTFARSVVLPNSVNEDETAAEFKDGVLKIVIPKSEESKPRKITIKK
jgi:HSP20 family protein